MNETAVLEVKVNDLSVDELTRRIESAMDRATRPPLSVCYVNAESILRARQEPEVMAAMRAIDIRCPDGVSVTAASKLRKAPLSNRFSGIDTLQQVLMLKRPVRHFFMGAREETLTRIRERVESANRQHQVVGTFAPPIWPWGRDMDQQILRSLTRTKPDCLWVGLSAPKQELWIARHKEDINASVVLAIGYAFDTFSGVKPLAPDWVRRAGLEWLYRLARHPAHTWRRVFITGPRFSWAVVRDAVQASRSGRRGFGSF